MVIHIEIGLPHSTNRQATVTLAPEEIRSISLSVASAGQRNRTGLYMRRHPKPQDAAAGIVVDPNKPFRSPQEPRKLTIPQHLELLGSGALAPAHPVINGPERYQTRHAMLDR